MKQQGKRGQLTILLIIAALLLLAAGITWYLLAEFDDTRTTGGSLATEQSQLERFVESCLETSSLDVFLRIGEQGGYVNPARDGIPALPGFATDGPAFEAFSGMTLPYWSYMSSPNDCAQCLHASQQPPLEGTAFPAIQYQAEQEIALQTIFCLAEFDEFAGQYTVTPRDDARVRVVFGETDIAIELDYPLSVQGASGSSDISRFQTRLDIPLRRLYETADAIRRVSDATGYFENRALEEVTLATAVDGVSLPPPQGGMEIGYDPGPFWALAAIEPVVFDFLERGIAMTQLFGSRDADFIATGNPMHDNLYLQYYLFLDGDYSDVQANFLYFTDWGGYLNVNPRRGQLIRPELISSGIPFIPNIKRMDFQYDISHPVLIQLRAPMRTDEYLFQFPIEVNLRRNSPTAYTPITAVPSLQDICDPEQANGPLLSIATRDQEGRALAANVRFECVNAACPLGESAGGSLTARVPACLQGVLIAEREGYLAAEYVFDAASTAPLTAELSLQQLTTVDVQLRGFQLVKENDPVTSLPTGGWVYGSEVPITNKQTAIVELEPQGFGESQFIVVPPQDQGRTSMELAPGTYAIRVFIIENLDEPKLLRGGDICSGIWPFETCNTIPDVTLGEPTYTNPETGETYDAAAGIPVGGLTWDETTKFVTISANDLAANRIQVPVIVINSEHLTRVLDLQIYEMIDELSMDLDLIPVPLSE